MPVGGQQPRLQPLQTLQPLQPRLQQVQRPIQQSNVRFTSIPAESPAPLVPSPDRPSVSIPAQPKGMPTLILRNLPAAPALTLPPTPTTEYIETPARPRVFTSPPPPAVFTTTTPRITTTTEALTSEELEDQAKSAYYNFGTSISDSINDHAHVREETREGLALKGKYSYSDGFFKRTVEYVADEGGYRVIHESVEPLNIDGPKFNPKGKADVSSTLTGDYSIGIEDFRLTKQQLELVEKEKTDQ